MSNTSLRAAAEVIEKFVDGIGRAVSWVAILLIALMTTNVMLRYVFSFGTVWAQELEWHLMGVLILFGMSYALLKDDNVRVDLFYAHYSEKTKFIVDVVSLLLQIAICIIVIWLTLGYVQQSYSIGEISADPGGLPYRWAIKGLLPLGYALLLVQTIGALLMRCLRRSEGSRKGEASHV